MSFLNILLYIILPVFAVAYFYVKKKWSYFEDEKIPYIKASGVMGSMSEVGRTLHFTEFLRKVYNNGRGKDVIAGYYTMLSPTIMITDVELLKRVLIKDFNVFSDRGFFVNEKKDILTGSLVSHDGEKWRFLRQKLTPAFTSGKIKLMFSAIKEQGDILLETIDKASKSGSVDMKDIANRYNIDITSSCAFGMESKTMKNEHPEFVSVFRRVFGEEGVGLAYFFFLMQFKKLALFLNLRQFDKDVIAFFRDIVSGAIKYREDNNVTRPDYLNMLIQLKNTGSIDGETLSESRKLTMDQCVSQAFVFFLGGVDTSSTTLSFVILQLGQRSEVQEKLREEVLEKIKDSNDEITYENLQEMTYLQQVLNETMRLHPAAFVSFRQAMQDYQIPGSKHVIKKGTQVLIPNICFHYDDRYWDKPEEFNPSRFSPEESAKRPSVAYIPFGEGPRNCIGMRFANVNLKHAVASIVRNYKITVDTSKVELPIRLDPQSALGPVGGFWVNFEKIL